MVDKDNQNSVNDLTGNLSKINKKSSSYTIFRNSIKTPDAIEGKYPWPILSIVLSIICIIGLILNKLHMGGLLYGILGFLYFIGTPLAIASALIFFIVFITNQSYEKFSILFLKAFLALLPFFLIWAPAPYGLIPTFSSQKADSGPACIGHKNITPDEPIEVESC